MDDRPRQELIAYLSCVAPYARRNPSRDVARHRVAIHACEASSLPGPRATQSIPEDFSYSGRASPEY